MCEIRLATLTRFSGLLVFSYTGTEGVEAWVENANKHYPHILALETLPERREIRIDRRVLSGFMAQHPGHRFRLCVCNAKSRFAYSVSDDVRMVLADDPGVRVEGDTIFFEPDCQTAKTDESLAEEVHKIVHKNKDHFELLGGCPIPIIDIGTCFSRSIFKSDEFFNPEYKSYFRVDATLFHNSYISLFSDPVPFDVSGIEDLHAGDAGKYVGVEFDKNIDRVLRKTDAKVVVTDLYVDASIPVVRVRGDSFLTYNKYVSESIFKRQLSSCEVIYPGTKTHEELLRRGLVAFHRLLEEHCIRDVVLIGGRLSRHKIDEQTKQTALWEDKADWIAEVNHNWDIADKLFLEELPESFYIDKRSTPWLSDVHSPILGGSSPSHYQSGYYKELFQEILALTKEERTHE